MKVRNTGRPKSFPIKNLFVVMRSTVEQYHPATAATALTGTLLPRPPLGSPEGVVTDDAILTVHEPDGVGARGGMMVKGGAIVRTPSEKSFP
tara:strand:- start:96 stop:371 length:276 start_codon:yes stop_codon:yes gene_type:complete